jgi:hypothetical protein
MNSEKARDFFSSYHEGTLERGLKQALEQRFAADPTLAADYAAFDETMRELSAMSREEVETPIYLSDRIATRLDQVFDRPKARISLGQIWRGLAVTATGAAVIGIVAVGLNNRPHSPEVAVGNLISTPQPAVNSDQLNFEFRDGAVTLSYRPTTPKTVVVSSGTNGAELKKFELDNQVLKSPLSNDLPSTALFCIQIEGEGTRSLLAMPGTKRITEKTGSGTLSEFAVALAGYYHVPVLVPAADAGKAITWDFSDPDSRHAATTALSGQPYSVDQRASGMLVIL